MIDCAIVRAHQQAASGKGGRDQAPGRSRGGLTTRIHMLADALGRPSRFIIKAGQVGEITQASSLPQGQSGDLVLADKACDSKALRQIIAGIGAEAVIPSNGLRKIIIPHDERACAHRNHIGRCFSQMKLFRRFASRYDRRAVHLPGLRLSRCRYALDAVNVRSGLARQAWPGVELLCQSWSGGPEVGAAVYRLTETLEDDGIPLVPCRRTF